MPSEPEDKIIRSPEQFERIMKDRREKAKNRIVNQDALTTDKPSRYSHADIANQLLKVISVLNIHPLCKRVLTMRIMGPITTGQEASYVSIAITLGLRVEEVKEIETDGFFALEDVLSKVSSTELVEKFNRDSNIEKMVREIKQTGKSPTGEVRKENEYEKKKFII